jgi:hypothetical protein
MWDAICCQMLKEPIPQEDMWETVSVDIWKFLLW